MSSRIAVPSTSVKMASQSALLRRIATASGAIGAIGQNVASRATAADAREHGPRCRSDVATERRAAVTAEMLTFATPRSARMCALKAPMATRTARECRQKTFVKHGTCHW